MKKKEHGKEGRLVMQREMQEEEGREQGENGWLEGGKGQKRSESDREREEGTGSVQGEDGWVGGWGGEGRLLGRQGGRERYRVR